MQRLIVALLIVAGTFITFGPRLNISGMACGSEKAQDSINKSFQVGPGGLLTVQAEQGSIEVRASNSNRVEVDIIRKAEAGSLEEASSILKSMEVRFEQTGNNLLVVAESPRSRARRQLEFKITVPRSYNVDLKTSGGSIEVEGLEGEARSKTSGGSLQFRTIRGPVTGKTSGGSIGLADIFGDVTAETSGGSISAKQIDGNLLAYTSGGSITAERIGGRLTAKTSGGSVRVDEVAGSVEASSSGGSVTARFTKQPAGDSQFTTSGGSVVVSIPEGTRANLDAEVSGGHVETDFPVSFTVQGKLDGSKVKGTINGGGPVLFCRTSGSNIQIRRSINP
jgi:hypothetical protein